QMSSGSSITRFLLLPFADTWELQLLHVWLFLGISLAALLGNGRIITTQPATSASTTVTKPIASSFWNTRATSFLGCAAQVFFFLSSNTAELYLLTIMSYNRYMSICQPLHHGTLLSSRACIHMAAAAWARGFPSSLL
ncbi:O14I1 protein, partial [Probosciger aterrimus]|nr:O14I1 protein [Probosciger aterrimus]